MVKSVKVSIINYFLLVTNLDVDKSFNAKMVIQSAVSVLQNCLRKMNVHSVDRPWILDHSFWRRFCKFYQGTVL